MAHVQVAIGVRRAVVEDEALPAGAGLAQALVQLLLRPAGKDRRLLLARPAFIGKSVFGRKTVAL